jgi:hypothetical protein
MDPIRMMLTIPVQIMMDSPTRALCCCGISQA